MRDNESAPQGNAENPCGDGGRFGGHTPGPWYAYHVEGGIMRDGYTEDDADVAIVVTNRPASDFEQDGNPGDRVAFVLGDDAQALADAALIAAAPDLLTYRTNAESAIAATGALLADALRDAAELHTLVADLWAFIENGDCGTGDFFALRERVRGVTP